MYEQKCQAHRAKLAAYYLYEEDGKLAILPWDYNLAFGGMNGSDGTSLVNSPIDSPVATANVSDRPLIAWIFEDDEALTQYHEVSATVTGLSGPSMRWMKR